MESVFQNLDFVGILSIGISGFGFLLILMAFFLIYKEQNRPDEPRKGILSTIRFFMVINIVNIIIVGVIGLPAIQRNKNLKENNENLAMANQKKEAEIKVLNDGIRIDSVIIQNLDPKTPDVSADAAAEAIESFTQSLDTLQARSKNTPWDDSIRMAKENLAQYAQAIRADKLNDTIPTKEAFEQIRIQRNKVNSWMLKSREVTKQP